MLLAVGRGQPPVPAGTRLGRDKAPGCRTGRPAVAGRPVVLGLTHVRSATRTGSVPGIPIWTDVPGVRLAAAELVLSTLTATSPDSNTLILVSEPRKVV